MRGKRLAFVPIVAAFGLAACGGSEPTGGGGASAQGTTKVQMAIQEGALSNLPAVVAQEQGIFRKHRLDVEFVPMQGGAVLSSVVSGAVQFVSQSPQIVGTARQQGQDLQFFSGGVRSNWSVLAAQKSAGLPATSDGADWKAVIQGLKGKKVGIAALGATQEQWMNGLIKGAGLARDDITLVPVGVGAPAIAALDSKQVDAVLTQPSAEQALVARGDISILQRLDEGGPFAGEMLTGYIASAKWLDSHADVAKRLQQSLAEATQYFQDPANAKTIDALLIKTFGVKAPEARQAILASDGPISKFDTAADCAGLERAISNLEQAGTLKPTSEPCKTMLWTGAAQ
jgi:ABC-type nitrate/sulfonate/bicarbonate transport system substrate-binding protein